MEGGKRNRTFIKRGEKVIVKEITSDIVLTDFDIVNDLSNARSNQAQYLDKLKQHEAQINAINENLKGIKTYIDGMTPFEQDATNRLRARIKQLVNKHKSEAEKKAKERLVRDIGADDVVWRNELFNAYRRELHTHPKIAKEIPDNIIRESLYGTKPLIKPKDITL